MADHETSEQAHDSLADAIGQLERQARDDGCLLTSYLLNAAKEAVTWEALEKTFRG